MVSVGKAAPTRERALRTGPVVTSHRRLGPDRPALRQDGATVAKRDSRQGGGSVGGEALRNERDSRQSRGGGVDLPKAECAAAA